MQTEKGERSGMSELTQKRTPELIGAEIRMYVDAGRRLSLLCGIEIGRRLVEAKQMLEHGEWLPWLERETEFSSSSAQRYMKLFDEYGAAQGSLFGPETNSPTLGNLPISKALALLSVPESDRIEFAEAVDAEHISVRELEQKIREREDQLEAMKKDQEGSEKALAEARKRIQELAKLNDELEHRPVEVAVERDEAAIKEAVKAAKAEAEKQNERAQAGLQKQLADAEKKLKTAEKDLKAAEKERDRLKQTADSAGADAEKKAEEANREVERLQAELEEAKKQLKTSDSDVTKFGVWFNQVQSDFLKMTEALQQITERDPETGKKLKTGATALLKNLLERMQPEEE